MKTRTWLTLSALGAGGAAVWWATRPRRSRTFRMNLPPGEEPAVSEPGSILFIGTATTLIRFGGLTILTDPNFLHRGEKIHVGYGMHGTRLTNPSMNFEELPPIDLVILSHMHEDHFDKLVQERMAKDTPILTTVAAARSLRRKGFTQTVPLRTWDAVAVRKGHATVRLTAMPGRHGPLLVSAMMPSVIGSMLEFGDERSGGEYRMYITGDTLLFRDIWEIPRRYPKVDLALLHLGGTRVMGILVTMNAEQGVKAMEIISPETAIPIHYNDYNLFKEPLQAFIRSVAEAGLEYKVQYLRHGETYSFFPRGAYTVDQPTF